MKTIRVHTCVHCNGPGCSICAGTGKVFIKHDPNFNVLVEQIFQIDYEVEEAELDIRVQYGSRDLAA